MPPPDADFSFTIDFEKGSGDPRRVFDAASALVDAFEMMDQALVNVLDTKLKTLMVLEDVESGSLKVWLKNLLTVPAYRMNRLRVWSGKRLSVIIS